MSYGDDLLATPRQLNMQDTALVIPAYEPSGHLFEIVRQASDLGFQIIVVNDGSSPLCGEVFEECAQLPGVTVLVHHSNLGKGRALKTAFEYCTSADHGIRYVITADADGQHSMPDITKLASEIRLPTQEEHPVVLLGSRDFTEPGVPWKSRLGNSSTTGLVTLALGHTISDTQTGLRAFPLSVLPLLLRVKGEGFEYEMNCLITLISRSVVIKSVPIGTIYHDVANSQSHFRPLRDSFLVWFQVFKFSASSLLGAAVDLAVYALIINILFGGRPSAGEIVGAVVFARVISGALNYLLNRRLVFNERTSLYRSLGRYLLLAMLLVSLSALGSAILSPLLGGHAVWAKATVDTILFVASFAVQKWWVFVRANSTRQ